VGNSEEIFNQIKADFDQKSTELHYNEIIYIPVSALLGDNIVEKSENITWYQGEALLPYLEKVELDTLEKQASRFQVQWVIRPNTEEYHDYRGYAGLVLSGTYKVGDKVKVLPSGIETVIEKIERKQQFIDLAKAGENVTIHLQNNIDISRGDSIVKIDELPREANELKTWLCWLDTTPIQLGKTYLLQHRFKTVRIKVQSIEQKWNINEWQFSKTDELKLNDIAQVTIKSNQNVFFDAFDKISANGQAILIDETSYNTVGACMLL
jgi:sulfate adenylyltransferase subunit 1